MNDIIPFAELHIHTRYRALVTLIIKTKRTNAFYVYGVFKMEISFRVDVICRNKDKRTTTTKIFL